MFVNIVIITISSSSSSSSSSINNEISRLPNKLFDKMIQNFYRFSLIFGITKNVEIMNVRYEDSVELTSQRTFLVAIFTAHSSPF